jgi:hypothetical protein
MKHHEVTLSAKNLLVGGCDLPGGTNDVHGWEGGRLDVRINGSGECSGKIGEADGSAERHTW